MSRKDSYIQIRLNSDFKKEIEILSKFESRSVTSLIESLLIRHLRVAKTSDEYLEFRKGFDD